MARLDSPQDVVEAALATATTDGTVVIVTDRSEANLRWANSSLTTNGEMSSRSVTVIATNGSADGTSAGVVGRTVTDADAVRELLAEAEAAARTAEPAPDAAPLVTPEQAGVGTDFALDPETTSVGAFARVAADLGEAFAAGGRPASTSASPSRWSTRSTSGRRPGCGCDTSSPRAGSR